MSSSDTLDDASWQPDFGHLSATVPTWAAKRPVRLAVLGDFSGGAAAGRLETGAALAKRKPIPVEFDTLDDALARCRLQLSLPLGAGGSPVELSLGELDAFHPDALYREVELFTRLSSLRKQLNNTATFAKAAAELQGWTGDDAPLRKASRIVLGQRSRGATPAPGARLDDFARLMGRTAVTAGRESDIDALLRDVVGPFVVAAPNPQKDAMVAAVDGALSDAMRAVLHHPEFQNVESLWRGIDFLVRRLETGPQLQVHLIDISAEELAADLGGVDDLADSGLYQLLVGQPSQDKAGGYTHLLGLYRFEATPPQAELLGRMAKVAVHAGAPFITSLAADGLGDRKKPPHPLVEQAFLTLRAQPEAGYLGLLAPRFLLRHPYGKRSDPISSFAFEEFSVEDGLRGMLWGHPALLAAVLLAGPAAGGQTVDDLPFHHVVDADGDSVALPCTERWVAADTATWLGRFGIVAVQAHKGEPLARLSGLEALNGEPLPTAGSAPRTGRIEVGIGRGTPGAARPAVTARVAAPRPSPTASTASAAAAAQAASDDGTDALADTGAGVDDGGMDDLDALLASLNDDTASADTGDAGSSEGGDDAAGDDEMDPELAELLKSLG